MRGSKRDVLKRKQETKKSMFERLGSREHTGPHFDTIIRHAVFTSSRSLTLDASRPVAQRCPVSTVLLTRSLLEKNLLAFCTWIPPSMNTEPEDEVLSKFLATGVGYKELTELLFATRRGERETAASQPVSPR